MRIYHLIGLASVLLLIGCTPSPERLGMSEQQWQGLNQEQQQKILADYEQVKSEPDNKTVYSGPSIMVYVSDGRAMMPPFDGAYSFDPVQILLAAGDCRSALLESIDTGHSVYLKTCYDGQALMLDPSPYKVDQAQGSVRLQYNPAWKRGFSYTNVNSSGYAHLQKVMITVKAMPAGMSDQNTQSDMNYVPDPGT